MNNGLNPLYTERIKTALIVILLGCWVAILMNASLRADVTTRNAEVTFGYTVSDADAIKIEDAICGLEGYPTLVDDPNTPGARMANPESCRDWTDAWLREFLRIKVIQWKGVSDVRAVPKPTSADRIAIDGKTTG